MWSEYFTGPQHECRLTFVVSHISTCFISDHDDLAHPLSWPVMRQIASCQLVLQLKVTCKLECHKMGKVAVGPEAVVSDIVAASLQTLQYRAVTLIRLNWLSPMLYCWHWLKLSPER